MALLCFSKISAHVQTFLHIHLCFGIIFRNHFNYVTEADRKQHVLVITD